MRKQAKVKSQLKAESADQASPGASISTGRKRKHKTAATIKTLGHRRLTRSAASSEH